LCVAESAQDIVSTAQSLEPEKSFSGDEILIPLPVTQLFEPLRADPKEPRFFVSALHVSSDVRDTTIAAVGFGENFGVVRQGLNPDKGWQLGISAAVFAQFDLESESSDLMNADYVIGVPVTWRNDNWSGRVRVYHQSSHLGDEYILNTQPERVNLSFESMEVLMAFDFAGMRYYGGGEYLFHREPTDLAEGLIHIGFDWRDEEAVFDISHLANARWVAGVDVKRWQQNDWAIQISAKAGLEFSPNRRASTGSRHWSLLMEFFDGASPYGQFYKDDLRYLGVAVQLGL
jgi:hypothetical protein